ncbi:hypothetical protein FRC01_010472 [Tulasnella sp. 417]|nr:hypothetical protein FRC01_010472 [Tulasnella sp. 417]
MDTIMHDAGDASCEAERTPQTESASNTFIDSYVVDRANVANGFLKHLKEMLGPVRWEGWYFGALRTIRLHAIPKELRERYEISFDELKAEDGATMSAVLEGTFTI